MTDVENKNQTGEIKKMEWFERQFTFGLPAGMLPFYIERLTGTIVRLEKKVQGIPEDILSYKLDGKWSVKQNIGHLAEVDAVTLTRIDEIVNGVSPMSPAVFEPRLDYNAEPVKKVLQYFDSNRAAHIKRYASLTHAELSKASIHPRLKVMMTPIDIALFAAEHDDHHSVRINEIIKALYK